MSLSSKVLSLKNLMPYSPVFLFLLVGFHPITNTSIVPQSYHNQNQECTEGEDTCDVGMACIFFTEVAAGKEIHKEECHKRNHEPREYCVSGV